MYLLHANLEITLLRR